MKYLKIKEGNLFAYDEQVGITLCFRDNWKMSSIGFYEIERDAINVEYPTEKEVEEITKGNKAENYLAKLNNYLNESNQSK